jgi:lipid A disaccharide synthetase
VYRTSWLSYLYFKRRVNLSHYSLPNILAMKEVYPELIQDDFQPGLLRRTLLELPEQDDIRTDCRKLWASLAGPEAYRRIAEKIREVSE